MWLKDQNPAPQAGANAYAFAAGAIEPASPAFNFAAAPLGGGVQLWGGQHSGASGALRGLGPEEGIGRGPRQARTRTPLAVVPSRRLGGGQRWRLLRGRVGGWGVGKDLPKGGALRARLCWRTKCAGGGAQQLKDTRGGDNLPWPLTTPGPRQLDPSCFPHQLGPPVCCAAGRPVCLPTLPCLFEQLAALSVAVVRHSADASAPVC